MSRHGNETIGFIKFLCYLIKMIFNKLQRWTVYISNLQNECTLKILLNVKHHIPYQLFNLYI